MSPNHKENRSKRWGSLAKRSRMCTPAICCWCSISACQAGELASEDMFPPASAFLNQPGAIGGEECLQVVNLLLNPFAKIGILHANPDVVVFEDLRCRIDVQLLFDSLLGRFKGLMRGEKQSIGVVHERISGDPGVFLVGFRESSVNHQ